jgi:hypothetical protein
MAVPLAWGWGLGWVDVGLAVTGSRAASMLAVASAQVTLPGRPVWTAREARRSLYPGGGPVDDHGTVGDAVRP